MHQLHDLHHISSVLNLPQISKFQGPAQQHLPYLLFTCTRCLLAILGYDSTTLLLAHSAYMPVSLPCMCWTMLCCIRQLRVSVLLVCMQVSYVLLCPSCWAHQNVDLTIHLCICRQLRPYADSQGHVCAVDIYRKDDVYTCMKESDADKLNRVQEAASMLATLQSVFSQVRHDWWPFAADRRLLPSSSPSVNLRQCCAVLHLVCNLCKSRYSYRLRIAYSHSLMSFGHNLVAVLHTFYHFNICDDK